jgi:hypothetical protein
VTQIQGGKLALPTLGLGMGRISALTGGEHSPDRVQFAVLPQQMRAAED